MLAVIAALVSSRTLPFSLPSVLLIVVMASLRRNGGRQLVPAIGNGSLAFSALIGYAALSALWAQFPYVTLFRAGVAAGCFIAAGIIAHAMLCEPRRNIFHIGEGLWIGLIIGLVYLLAEILSRQTIKLHLYNTWHIDPSLLRPPAFFTWKDGRLMSIAPDDLKRNIAPITLMLWSAMLAIKGTAPARAGRWIAGLVFILASTVILLSAHATSKAALVGGALVFILARVWPRWSERILRFTWVAACLAVIPMALALHRGNLHTAPWVQPSMQHRIVIWNHTAEMTLNAPILGIGAGMTYELFGTQGGDDVTEKYDPRVPHAHNVYLQTWFELGVIGAALLTLVGLAVLERIRRLGPHVAPYAQATFACGAIIASSSYGIWQEWFLAMYAFAVVLFAIAVRTVIHKERTPGLVAALA